MWGWLGKNKNKEKEASTSTFRPKPAAPAADEDADIRDAARLLESHEQELRDAMAAATTAAASYPDKSRGGRLGSSSGNGRLRGPVLPMNMDDDEASLLTVSDADLEDPALLAELAALSRGSEPPSSPSPS